MSLLSSPKESYFGWAKDSTFKVLFLRTLKVMLHFLLTTSIADEKSGVHFLLFLPKKEQNHLQQCRCFAVLRIFYFPAFVPIQLLVLLRYCPALSSKTRACAKAKAQHDHPQMKRISPFIWKTVLPAGPAGEPHLQPL